MWAFVVSPRGASEPESVLLTGAETSAGGHDPAVGRGYESYRTRAPEGALNTAAGIIR